MFGLFSRKKVPKDWEIQLLIEGLSALPAGEFSHYVEGIQAGLLATRRVEHIWMPNMVKFGFTPGVSGRFELKKGRFFFVRGIKVFDRSSLRDVEVILFFNFGFVTGYATPEADNFDPDLSTLSTERWYREYQDTDNIKEIEGLLGDAVDLVNPAHVFEVEIDGRLFYHLLEIGDGDFVGIDSNGTVYECFHDPFEIRPCAECLKDVLKKYSSG